MAKETVIRMRWCSVAFYEIVLPDGTVIITDPAQYRYPENMVAEKDYLRYSDRSAAEILDRVDYILISHIHFDHVQDLTQVIEKFPDARIIVPDTSTVALLLEKNISTLKTNVFAVGHEDELRFPEFTLKSFAGKHTVFASTDPFLKNLSDLNYREDYKNPDGSIDYIKSIFWAAGGFDPRNYLITTPEGATMLIWAGQIGEDFRRYLYRDMQPDVMFVQIAGTNIGGDRRDPKAETIGEFALDVKPQYVLPIHQEKYTKECLAMIKDRCNGYFEAHGSSIRYDDPAVFEWFEVRKNADGKVQIAR